MFGNRVLRRILGPKREVKGRDYSGRPRYRWEDCIKIVNKNLCEVMDSIHLAQV
jgi:hypothetical protein